MNGEERKSPIQRIKERFSDADPMKLVLALVVLLVLIGIGIGVTNYYRRNGGQKGEAPSLVIERPTEGATVEEDKVSIEGETDSGATVFVNGKESEVSQEGVFTTEVPLSEGQNKINIVAKSKEGQETEYTLTVNRPVKEAEVPGAGVPNAPKKSLTSSGPETLFIPELSVLSVAAAGYWGARKRLERVRRESN